MSDGGKTVTYAVFLSRFPEFTGIPQSAIVGQLIFSSRLWKKYVLCDNWQELVCLYVAHRLARRFNLPTDGQYSGAAGGIATSQSASTSSLSISRATNAMMTGDDPFLADLATTKYGEEFLALLSLIMPVGFVVY